MFNMREVLACLFSYVSSWLQFDRIKPNCRLASWLDIQTTPCSDIPAPCFLPVSVVSTEHDKKNGEKKKSRGISPKKAQFLAFPIIKSSCFFLPLHADRIQWLQWTMQELPRVIYENMTYVCENKSISVPDSRASEKNAENVGSPLMRRTGQVPFSCRQLEIGLWAYNFFSRFTLFTVTLHVPLSM